MPRRIHCGINIDPANPRGRPSPQELQELGASWVRFTFKDSSDGSEPTRFGFYDPVIEELQGADLEILMILSYETFPGKPAFDASQGTWNAYTERFMARARQIAAHYGSQVLAYEIWNEPDLPEPRPGFDPRVPAPAFGRLLRSTFRAIKEVSSSMVVVGGLAAGHPAYLERVRAITDGIVYADLVGVHPYGRRPTPDWPRPDWGFGVLGDLVELYHKSAQLPIWITEIGTDDVSVQDPFPGAAFEALNEDLAEVAGHVFWFCWSDGMVPPYGLVDAGGARKGSYTSYQQFASQPFEGIFDRFSVHWSGRQGQDVRFIIVHSTDSPAGSPAENTLRFLIGPNDRKVSAHELLLPGGRVYRMVPESRAAHHCETPTVRFPDGTPSHLANEITWGIEAYQIRGRPVGQEVLASTLPRIVAACRRFGLDSSRVLGHREIDPDVRTDPVGVDMDVLRRAIDGRMLEDVLLAEGDRHQVIQFNPDAALQSRIFADGFSPNSPEFDVEFEGVLYRGQRAENLDTGQVRVYYARVPNWDDVRFVERQ